MKRKSHIMISALYLMLIMSMGSGCAFTITPRANPTHKVRKVWINEVYYEQVYYKQGKNIVVVSQRKIPHKKNKDHQDNGNHGHKK